jgi:hypothetical protein
MYVLPQVTHRLSESPAIITDHESGAVRRMMKMVVRDPSSTLAIEHTDRIHIVQYAIYEYNMNMN